MTVTKRTDNWLSLEGETNLPEQIPAAFGSPYGINFKPDVGCKGHFQVDIYNADTGKHYFQGNVSLSKLPVGIESTVLRFNAMADAKYGMANPLSAGDALDVAIASVKLRVEIDFSGRVKGVFAGSASVDGTGSGPGESGYTWITYAPINKAYKLTGGENYNFYEDNHPDSPVQNITKTVTTGWTIDTTWGATDPTDGTWEMRGVAPLLQTTNGQGRNKGRGTAHATLKAFQDWEAWTESFKDAAAGNGSTCAHYNAWCSDCNYPCDDGICSTCA